MVKKNHHHCVTIKARTETFNLNKFTMVPKLPWYKIRVGTETVDSLETNGIIDLRTKKKRMETRFLVRGALLCTAVFIGVARLSPNLP